MKLSMSQIVSINHNVRPLPSGTPGVPDIYTPGEDLRMRDGSLWFHSYSGGKPVVIEPAKRPRPGPDKPGMDQWGMVDEVEEFAW